MDVLWMEAYEESVRHRKPSEIKHQVENRKSASVTPEAETVTKTAFRYKLWRKVYDRSARADAYHGMQGRIVAGKDSLVPSEQSMTQEMNLICRDLFCYHSNYAYIGKPQKTPIGPEMTNIRLILNFFRHPGLAPDMRVSTLVPSGSASEDLKAPPTVKNFKMLKNGVQSDAELIEASDYDIMLVMEDILPVSKVASPGVQIETGLTSPGYLRIRILDNCLVKKFPCLLDDLSQNYYLSGLACDALKSTQMADILESLNNKTDYVRFSMDAERKGPARKNFIQLLIRESGNEIGTNIYYPLEVDLVGAFPCLEWPSVAADWLSRDRSSRWPSKELIGHILLEGCHIVATSHCKSEWPDAEFRFSFSHPEALLSKFLIFEQKQCYASFKGIIKHAISKLEEELGREIKLKSYHLKNVFLWACETIPQEEWFQQDTWPKCLLFLIDQLLYCLEQRVMPGYFIPQCNLFDPIPAELFDILKVIILSVREDPLMASIEFLKATVLYRDIKLEHILISLLQSSTRHLTKPDSQANAVNCLQRLIIAFDSNDKKRFGKKAAIYDIFANWSKSQTNLSISDCLSRKFSLFDVVYLDVSYDAAVAEDTLHDFADRESSSLAISKLALCYCEAVFENVTAEKKSHRDEYARKAILLFEKSIARERKCDAVMFAVFLCRLERYEDAIRALEPMLQILSEETDEPENVLEIRIIKIFVNEAIARQLDGKNDCRDTYLPPKSLAYLLLVHSYLNLNGNETAGKIATEFEQYCCVLESSKSHLSFYLLGLVYDKLKKRDEVDKYFRMALQSKLLSCGLASATPARIGHSKRPTCFHIDVLFSLASWAADLVTTEDGAQNFLDAMRRRLSEIPFSGSHISKTTYFCMSVLIKSPCSHCNQFMASASAHFRTLIAPIRWSAMHHIPTAANKLYYAHLMMQLTIGESILPILLEVIEMEKRHPMSVVIWSTELRVLMDEYVRREVDEAEERGFIVIPSIVYAYYLLAKLYLRLGKMEEHEQTMRDFEALCVDVEDLSPVSYSLLSYAYLQLAAHEEFKDSETRSIQPDPKQTAHGASQCLHSCEPSPPESASSLSLLRQRSFYIEMTDQIVDYFFAGFTEEQRTTISDFFPIFEYGSEMEICAMCDAAT